MGQRSAALSRIHKLSSDDLEKVAQRVLTRSFGPPIRNKRTGNVRVRRKAVPSKARTHGGRVGLNAADWWSLFEPGDDDRSGALLSETIRLKNKPGRVLCEIARLKALAKKRETARDRRRAVEEVRKKWAGSLPDLDKAGKARFAEAIKRAKEKLPNPDHLKEVAFSLRMWGIYGSAPSRTAVQRWAAGTATPELHAEILKIHDRMDRPYRIEPHIGIDRSPVKPSP